MDRWTDGVEIEENLIDKSQTDGKDVWKGWMHTALKVKVRSMGEL